MQITLHRKKAIEDSAFEHGGRVTDGRGQLDFTDQPPVHLEPPWYYKPLWGNNLTNVEHHDFLKTCLQPHHCAYIHYVHY